MLGRSYIFHFTRPLQHSGRVVWRQRCLTLGMPGAGGTQRGVAVCVRREAAESLRTPRPDAGRRSPAAGPGKRRDTVSVDKIRNIGIIAHIDAGKTTTTERMLYYSGRTKYLGDVDDGDTVMDYMEQERDRGITITSAAITFSWKRHRINLVDTPGHVDFTLEVERSLRVLDGAVAVLDASAGVEAQTLTVWRQADRYEVPCIAYVNKMDKTGADFISSVSSIQEKLRVLPLVVQVPLGVERNFVGVADVINVAKVVWDPADKRGNKFSCQPVLSSDSDLFNTVKESRTLLVEQLADLDDTIAELVLDDIEPMLIPADVVTDALRRVTLTRKAVPVFCGSSFKNRGVQLLLDAVVDYLPSPLDRHHDFIEFYKEDFCALVFKIIHDKQRGPLTFVRVYSGHLDSGSNVYNVNQGMSEKVGRLLQVSADEFCDIASVTEGNIVAISGLKQAVTGDTLASDAASVNAACRAYRKQQEEWENKDNTAVVLAGIAIPDPVFFCAIEIYSLSQQKGLDAALECLKREDPSLRVREDKETGQTILEGMGELHLEVIHSRIKTEYGVECDLGPLQIAYREAVTEDAQETFTLDRNISEKRHLVTVSVSVHPDPEGRSPREVAVVPDKDSDLSTRPRKHHLKAVKSGVISVLSRGPVLGYQMVHTAVELHDLKVAPGTSLPMVTACAAQAVMQAVKKAAASLLEPYMKLEIHTDELQVGRILADLSRRRSQILEIQAEEDVRTLLALTPLAELRGYSTTLRTLTSGTATFHMELASYERMTADQQQKAVAEVTGFASSL